MPTLVEQQIISAAQASAVKQVDWYNQHQLYYDKPPKAGRASWWLALKPHFVTPQEHEILTTETPAVIRDYHRTSSYLLEMALKPKVRQDSPTLDRLHQVVTHNVPLTTVGLWQELLNKGKNLPATSRPDLLISASGSTRFKHIEYNADGSADKGNTLGVNLVMHQVLKHQPIGIGLDAAYIQGIRAQLPHHETITVATILPDAYRTEYDPQNRFFAKQAHGIDEGVNWISAKLSEVEIRPDGVYTDGKKIDIIDREIKTPGFTDEYDFQNESDLLKAVVEDKVHLFGSVLPHGDKLFLATLFDPNLEHDIEGVIGVDGLARLRTWHPTTYLFDPNQKKYIFNGKEHDIGSIKNPGQGGFVLKHTGDNIYTTGSNGVYFSRGYKSDRWPEIVDRAIQTGMGKRNHLILQEMVDPQPFEVETISSTTATPKTVLVPNRFAPYYVWDGSAYILGNALVTAGTDREVTNLNSVNIHGQRDNTYQGVALR